MVSTGMEVDAYGVAANAIRLVIDIDGVAMFGVCRQSVSCGSSGRFKPPLALGIAILAQGRFALAEHFMSTLPSERFRIFIGLHRNPYRFLGQSFPA